MLKEGRKPKPKPGCRTVEEEEGESIVGFIYGITLKTYNPIKQIKWDLCTNEMC
jgi:hypothetical protein